MILLACEQLPEARCIRAEQEFARHLKGVCFLIPAGPRRVAAAQEVEEMLRTSCAGLNGFSPGEPVGGSVIRFDHRTTAPQGAGAWGNVNDLDILEIVIR